MRPEPHVLRRAGALVGVGAVVLLAACTGQRPVLTEEPAATTTTAAVGTDGEEPPPEPARLAAEATADEISIYPDETATEPQQELSADEATSTPGTPIVFRVIRERGERWEVELPTAPRGSTGWIDKTDVEVHTITYRIQVRLSDHRLRVFDVDDDVVVDEPIVVGDDQPDPGSYFVKELLAAPSPDSPYGRYAYVFSGSTTNAAAFDRGSGLVGLHGGAAEGSLGDDAARGCIGASDAVLDRLVDEVGLQLGTPVQVVR